MTPSQPLTGPEIVERLAYIQDQLSELRSAIIGNRPLGQKGLVERIETLELLRAEVPEIHRLIEERVHERVDVLEARWNRASWMAAGIGVGTGLTSGGLVAWISHLTS